MSGQPEVTTSKLHTNDFSKGPVWKNIVAQAVPLTLAQLVHLLYNVVDRIYIGHMNGGDGMALTGVGLTFPCITLILAFAALFGNGGVPLFSMRRGAGDEETAGRILGNSCALILASGAVLTVLGYAFCRPVLYAFGASDVSYAYASAYLRIYLIGTVPSMLATGLNNYINAQGFPRIGMMSIVLGAGLNIVLDPLFIFVLKLGVAGAAIATVISQTVSAAWILSFLCGRVALIRLRRENVRIRRGITPDIIRIGMPHFIVQATNFLVQVVCNSTLQRYGGDIYVGVMTVVNSVREIFTLPVNGVTSGSQPVISFNYGAKAYRRVLQGIDTGTVIGVVYTALAWLAVVLFPRLWFGIFSDDAQMTELGIGMLRLYFFGFVFMALQFAGQMVFQALGDARHGIFFSLLRKVIIVVPLALVLPALGFGVTGVFLAEPVSNVIGGLACFLTMRITQYRRVKRLAEEAAAAGADR